MFLKTDFFFTYKYILRFLLIHKYGLFCNTFEVPVLNKLFIFFCISDVVDIDDACFFNYPFLFRFFFGRRAFFTKFKSIFNLGTYFFSFQIFTFFNGRSCFFPIFFFVNDLKCFSDYNTYFVYPVFNNFNYFYINFYNLNIFLEKKTNIGLYNLKHKMHFKFCLKSYDFFSSFLFFDLLKLL